MVYRNKMFPNYFIEQLIYRSRRFSTWIKRVNYESFLKIFKFLANLTKKYNTNNLLYFAQTIAICNVKSFKTLCLFIFSTNQNLWTILTGKETDRMNRIVWKQKVRTNK